MKLASCCVTNFAKQPILQLRRSREKKRDRAVLDSAATPVAQTPALRSARTSPSLPHCALQPALCRPARSPPAPLMNLPAQSQHAPPVPRAPPRAHVDLTTARPPPRAHVDLTAPRAAQRPTARRAVASGAPAGGRGRGMRCGHGKLLSKCRECRGAGEGGAGEGG